MTFINSVNTNTINLLKPKITIFSLRLKNPRSSIPSFTAVPSAPNVCDYNNPHDSLHLIYSNIGTSQISPTATQPAGSFTPLVFYKPYHKNVGLDYATYGIASNLGYMESNNSISSLRILNPNATESIFFRSTDLANYQNYHYLRFYTGGTYPVGTNNIYRPDTDTLVLPIIKLVSGYEYFIEVINSSNMIKFNNFSIKNIATNLDASSLKIYMNNDSYNPHLYSSFINKKQLDPDYINLTYSFGDGTLGYNDLASQWASKIIIYQIPIV